MLVQGKEQLSASDLAEEAILCLVTSELLVAALEEFRILHPLDQVFLVVAEFSFG